jgi:microcystin-dependent protein
LGTTFGGDGRTTFGLPNLQGQVAIGSGQGPGLNNYVLGQAGGEVNHTLTLSELPQHTHALSASSSAANASTPGGNVLAATQAANYEVPATPVAMGYTNSGNAVIGSAGGNQPHNNLQPFLVLSFCICLAGIFPTQS